MANFSIGDVKRAWEFWTAKVFWNKHKRGLRLRKQQKYITEKERWSVEKMKKLKEISSDLVLILTFNAIHFLLSSDSNFKLKCETSSSAANAELRIIYSTYFISIELLFEYFSAEKKGLENLHCKWAFTSG